MEDIKELIKKAKKEEKKNAEFLYQLGLRFKNGDGVEAHYGKAYKYFTKSAYLGHIQGQIETALCWWKYYHSYYYADLFFNKAIGQGSEQAKQLLEQMQQEKESKKQAKLPNDNLIHCTGSKDVSLYEIPKFKDNDYTSFCKRHTLICCPACRKEIIQAGYQVDGELCDKMMTIYNHGTSFATTSAPYVSPTINGQTITQTYKCKHCEMVFSKTTHTVLKEKDKPVTFKEMITMAYSAGATEFWQHVEVKHQADATKVGKDVLKVLKKFDGKFDGKW